MDSTETVPEELPGPDENPACLCPVTGVMELLGKKYTMQILCVVGAYDSARFREIEGAIPDASTSTLSTRLEEVVEAGLVTREQFDEIPPRVEYELTADGAELASRLQPVLDWARERGG